ncbi:tobH protein [Rhodococcus rhodnii]|nr:hypothetical protein [Rhodococcus rhodnii]TXG92591.1 tobH protein [Rhodococcus rhodnii]
MTTPMPVLDLDDEAAIGAADRHAVLRSAATAGAQLRAAQAAVDEGELTGLAGMRPRSLVLVTAAGRPARAAALVSSTATLGFPVVRVPTTPSWVGPLDVVVVAGDDAGDPALAHATDAALRRRAETVVVAPFEGPLRDVAAGRARSLAPRIPAHPRHMLMRYLAGFLAVAAELGRPDEAAAVDLAALADAADAEAVRGGPGNEIFHNPAKSLASRVHGRRVVFTGADAPHVELARHAGEAAVFAGAVAASAPLPDVVAAAPTFRPAADVDPLFFDPDLDDPGDRPIRAFAFSSVADEDTTRRRLATVPDAEVLVASELGEQSGDVVAQLVTLATRVDLAAAYLQLMGGH